MTFGLLMDADLLDARAVDQGLRELAGIRRRMFHRQGLQVGELQGPGWFKDCNVNCLDLLYDELTWEKQLRRNK
jgi:hypothetical protein